MTFASFCKKNWGKKKKNVKKLTNVFTDLTVLEYVVVVANGLAQLDK